MEDKLHYSLGQSQDKQNKRQEDFSRNSFGQLMAHQNSQISLSLGDSQYQQTYGQRNKTLQFHLANLPGHKISDEELEEATSRHQREGALLGKFKDFVFKLKLQSWIKKIVSKTRSRMFRKLSFKQLEMIGDYSYDSIELSASRPKQQQLNALTNNDNMSVQTKPSVPQRVLLKLDQIFPVLSHQNSLITIIDTAGVLSVLFLLFTLSIAVSFQVPINSIVNVNFPITSFLIIILGIFVKLNTELNKFGRTITSRFEIWKDYYQTKILSDSFSLIAVILLLIIDHHSLGLDSSSPDLYSCLKFALFIPFFLKLKRIFSRIQNLEDKIAFRQRAQHVVQLGRLFAIIILIDHVMACIWIFNSKFTGNRQNNWLVYMKAVDYPWHYQYAMAFYYSTATMTTVGYGDITSQNMSEFILTTVLVMTSSGVFGFTLSQIGAIFSEFQAENKELKKKLNIINLYMDNKCVNHSLRSQVREYLEYTWKENNEKFVNDSAAVVEELNEDLKKQLYLHQNKKIINYLRTFFSEALIQSAISIIEEQQVKPQQIIQTQGSTEDICLYLIEKGKVEIYLDSVNPISKSQNVKSLLILEEGQVFGKSEFFNGEGKSVSVKALGFVNLLKIKRSEFIKILSEQPIDLETFHYLKDKLMFSRDYKKISDCCLSCNSPDHTLSTCTYLHLAIDKQSLFAKLNYKSYTKQTERRKEWIIKVSEESQQSENGRSPRRRIQTQEKIVSSRRSIRQRCYFIDQEDSEYEEFLLSNYDELDEYEEENLKYDFSHIYINQSGSDEDEDQRDDKHRFHKSETEGASKHQKDQLGEITTKMKQSISNFEQQKSAKTHENNNVRQRKDSSERMNQLIDQASGQGKISWKDSDTRQKEGKKKQTSIYENRKTTRGFTENHLSGNSNNSLNHRIQRMSADFYEGFGKQKENNNLNQEMSLNLQTPGSSHIKTDENLKESQEQQKQPIQQSKTVIDEESSSFQSSSGSHSSPGINSLDQMSLNGIPSLVQNNQSCPNDNSPIPLNKSKVNLLNVRTNNSIFPARQSVKRQPSRKVSFSQLRQMHTTNEKDTFDQQMQKSQQFQYPKQASIHSPNLSKSNIPTELLMNDLRAQIINEFQELLEKQQKKDNQILPNNDKIENDEYAKFLIFSSFDKQKNFTVYFPHNNLSTILLNYTARNKYISQQQYLQLIQQTGRSRNSTVRVPTFLQGSRNKLKEQNGGQRIFSLRHIALQNTNGYTNPTETNNNNVTLNNNNNTYSNFFVPHSQQMINGKVFKNPQRFGSSRQIILTDDSTARDQSEKLVASFRSPTRFATNQFVYKNDTIPSNCMKGEERSFDAEIDMISLQSPNVKDEPLEIDFTPFRQSVNQPTAGKNNAAYFINE